MSIDKTRLARLEAAARASLQRKPAPPTTVQEIVRGMTDEQLEAVIRLKVGPDRELTDECLRELAGVGIELTP